MATIMITVSEADLAIEMTRMREWLDARQCEPSRFICTRYGNIIAVCVEFIKDSDGDEFKKRFGGHPQAAETDAPVMSGTGPAVDFPALPRQKIETMEQVCWWRLMAEEVRTEAEGFSSASAKDTMQAIAATWDRLAEDLEHRLSRKSLRSEGRYFLK